MRTSSSRNCEMQDTYPGYSVFNPRAYNETRESVPIHEVSDSFELIEQGGGDGDDQLTNNLGLGIGIGLALEAASLILGLKASTKIIDRDSSDA